MALPFQQHQKLRQLAQNQRQNKNQVSLSSNSSLDILKDKPFWIWDRTEHLRLAKETKQQCCANHIWGLPRKNNKEYPLFDYEKLIFDAIENNQNIFILKSRGIGVTTFMIRYFAWKILHSSELDNKSIFIVSGTREEHASYIKEKLEQLFENFPITFESKYTELLLKKTWIKVFPTRNIKDIRGYFETSYIFVDESDYLEESIQDELMHAISPYEEKSNCKIILCSTPNRPLGLMQCIENDVNSKYTKLKLDYSYGLDKIYDRQFIEKKKLDAEFEREYNLKYLGRIGNLLSPLTVDKAVRTGELLKDIPVNQYCIHSLGIDPAFGSSSFGLVLTEHLQEEDKIRVLLAEEYADHPDPNAMVERIFQIHREFFNLHIFVDSAARGFITSLKIAFGENPHYEKVEDVLLSANKIIPVAFSTSHKQMIQHLTNLFEHEYIAVPQEHDKLIVSLRAAQVNEYSLLKEETPYNDIFDALRLSLKAYNIT